MGGVIDLGKSAGARGRLPKEAELRRAFAVPPALNIDALGKAYIIDRAVAVARRIAPAGLLNIGGDLRTWGPCACRIGIANPSEPAAGRSSGLTSRSGSKMPGAKSCAQ